MGRSRRKIRRPDNKENKYSKHRDAERESVYIVMKITNIDDNEFIEPMFYHNVLRTIEIYMNDNYNVQKGYWTDDEGFEYRIFDIKELEPDYPDSISLKLIKPYESKPSRNYETHHGFYSNHLGCYITICGHKLDKLADKPHKFATCLKCDKELLLIEMEEAGELERYFG